MEIRYVNLSLQHTNFSIKTVVKFILLLKCMKQNSIITQFRLQKQQVLASLLRSCKLGIGIQRRFA